MTCDMTAPDPHPIYTELLAEQEVDLDLPTAQPIDHDGQEPNSDSRR